MGLIARVGGRCNDSFASSSIAYSQRAVSRAQFQPVACDGVGGSGFQGSQILRFLVHNAFRLGAEHHRRGAHTDGDVIAIDRVGGRVVVTAGRTTQGAIFGEDRCDLSTCHQRDYCLLAVVNAGSRPDGASEARRLLRLEGHDDFAVSIEEVQLVSDDNVAGDIGQPGQISLLLRRLRLGARHHGCAHGTEGQAVAVQRIAAEVVVAARVTGGLSIYHRQGSRRLAVGQRQVAGAVKIGDELPGGTFQRCRGRCGRLAYDFHQRVLQRRCIGGRIGDRGLLDEKLVLVAGLELKPLDVAVEQRVIALGGFLDLETDLRCDTDARLAVGADEECHRFSAIFGGRSHFGCLCLFRDGRRRWGRHHACRHQSGNGQDQHSQ